MIMARIENWNTELREWLSPFLQKLGHKARRQMCPLYVAGLIGSAKARDSLFLI
jgi:hypothetical protein